MKSEKTSKSVVLKLLIYLPITFVFVPYFFILLFDRWQVRWFFGLILHIFLPFIPLSIALDRKIKLTRFNPEELPKNRYILRHLDIFFRLLLIAGSIGTLFSTIEYGKATIRLSANRWQPEHVRGIMEKFTAPYPRAVFLRDIYLEGSKDKLQLLYPFGKRPHSGLRYEFLVLPGTDIVLDLKEIPSK